MKKEPIKDYEFSIQIGQMITVNYKVKARTKEAAIVILKNQIKFKFI